MLVSVQKSLQELRDLFNLYDRTQMHRATCIDEQLLGSVIDFLGKSSCLQTTWGGGVPPPGFANELYINYTNPVILLYNVYIHVHVVYIHCSTMYGNNTCTLGT